jgi:protein phosphatase
VSELHVPELALVVLIGASGSGKSTFARRLFLPTEIVSSDTMRGLVSDDENDQACSSDAFELLYAVVRKRLERGKLTVVDATNVRPEARKPLLQLARDHHVFAAAIVLDVPDTVCIARNRERPERMHLPPHVSRGHISQLKRSLRSLSSEGFRFVHHLRGVEAIDATTLVRDRLWVNLKHERGPFDLVGDIHGCYDELCDLLDELGWVRTDGERPTARHPEGRKLVLVGDLVDRGPDSPAVLELAMNMVEDGVALVVNGNHDSKLLRALGGAQVKRSHGLAETMEQMEKRPEAFRERVKAFLDGLISHYVLDDGKLVVAHAGLPESLQGRSSGRVREFAMYGETTGEIDAYGLPVRLDWAREYRGRAAVVHGHVPVVEAEWHNNTLDLDTGCCFGGKLTAMRWPERELVSVPAAREHYPASKPLAEARTPQRSAEAWDITDITGRYHVETRLAGRIGVPEPNAAAALEQLSRFTIDPRWLIYLPPTMSPPATSQEPGLLEHPDQAFAYYAEQGVDEVVCEEKHMGSRGLFLVCRDEQIAHQRFGVRSPHAGIVWTRSGRRMFDAPLEEALLQRLRAAMDRAGLWEELGTGWVLLDTEVLPWSVKASALVDQQYAPVGVAALAATSAEGEALAQAAARGLPLEELQRSAAERLAAAETYDRAWRRYVWETPSPEHVHIAPFHLLASEGAVHHHDHRWHLAQAARLVGDGIRATAHRFVRLDSEAQRAEATEWWRTSCEAGGEGMVVKPVSFTVRGKKGLLQPAIKCRGPEYLAIIYGPEYRRPQNLERLRQRGLSTKRQLAVREFALGIEALERFVQREPSWRVHQAVAAILALEAEVVDPRL